MDTTDKNSELLTLSEVATYLKIAEKTVHRMVQKDEIPCFKIASQWRFKKGQIDEWIRGKMKNPSQSANSRLLETSPHKVPLSQLTNQDLALMDIKPGSKREVLAQLVEPLHAAGLLDDIESYIEKLMKREEMITTALAEGIALPHVRNPQENRAPFPAIVLGRCPEGCDYSSLDGKPTHLFFLIFSDNVTVHLRITSRINRILLKDGLIDTLKKAKNKEEFMENLFAEDHEIRRLETENQGE